MNPRPTAESFFRATVFVALLSVVAGCNDKDPESAQATANFTASTLSFVENNGAQTVSLTLDMPAFDDGVIVVTSNTTSPSAFATEPLAQSNQLKLAIKKGQTSIDFR